MSRLSEITERWTGKGAPGQWAHTHAEADVRYLLGLLGAVEREEPGGTLRAAGTLDQAAEDLGTLDGMAWWAKYDPEGGDANWGRCCLACSHAVPAGGRYHHECRPEPLTPERDEHQHLNEGEHVQTEREEPPEEREPTDAEYDRLEERTWPNG